MYYGEKMKIKGIAKMFYSFHFTIPVSYILYYLFTSQHFSFKCIFLLPLFKHSSRNVEGSWFGQPMCCVDIIVIPILTIHPNQILMISFDRDMNASVPCTMYHTSICVGIYSLQLQSMLRLFWRSNDFFSPFRFIRIYFIAIN